MCNGSPLQRLAMAQPTDLPGCQTSVGRYFDSDGYLGQEEILAEFSKLVDVSSQMEMDGNGWKWSKFSAFSSAFVPFRETLRHGKGMISGTA